MRPRETGETESRASASVTKSTGTTFAGLRPEPILKKIPRDGILSIAVSVK